MLKVKSHLDLLGKKATDRITGVTGIVTSVCFDLYGCIQASINPGVDKDGKPKDVHWYDVCRLQVTGKAVMPVPEFDWTPEKVASGFKGPAEKPAAKA